MIGLFGASRQRQSHAAGGVDGPYSQLTVLRYGAATRASRDQGTSLPSSSVAFDPGAPSCRWRRRTPLGDQHHGIRELLPRNYKPWPYGRNKGSSIL